MVHSAIVTDRDLAVRVVGQGLVPERTTLDEVMSTDIATLSPEDSQADAIRLMYRRKVRRIPLTDGGRLVGMVTLDDLLLDVVLESVVRRLTPDEADDLIAQLPSLPQPALEALPPGPDKSIASLARASTIAGASACSASGAASFTTLREPAR